MSGLAAPKKRTQDGVHGSILDTAGRAIFLLIGSAGLAVGSIVLHPVQDHVAIAHWQIEEVGLAELDMLADRLVVDARSRELYETEHIYGAVWLAEEAWDEALPEFLMRWYPEHAVVIYCGGQACAASKRVALRLLANLPEARVFVLKGGFPAWKAAQK